MHQSFIFLCSLSRVSSLSLAGSSWSMINYFQLHREPSAKLQRQLQCMSPSFIHANFALISAGTNSESHFSPNYLCSELSLSLLTINHYIGRMHEAASSNPNDEQKCCFSDSIFYLHNIKEDSVHLATLCDKWKQNNVSKAHVKKCPRTNAFMIYDIAKTTAISMWFFIAILLKWILKS